MNKELFLVTFNKVDETFFTYKKFFNNKKQLKNFIENLDVDFTVKEIKSLKSEKALDF